MGTEKLYLHSRMFQHEILKSELKAGIESQLTFVDKQNSEDVEILEFQPARAAVGAAALAIDRLFICDRSCPRRPCGLQRCFCTQGAALYPPPGALFAASLHNGQRTKVRWPLSPSRRGAENRLCFFAEVQYNKGSIKQKFHGG